MAGAMVEVETRNPQELACEGIELGAGGAVREHRASDGDVTLEHAGEAVAHLGARRADRDGAGDVGGAVLVLASGIDQEQLTGREPAIGPPGDAIVHDRAIGPGAGDGRKRNVLEQAGIAPEALERRDCADLGERAARRLALEPGEETHDRGSVADMRRARAGDLGRVLHSLHRHDRIRTTHDPAAVALDEARDRGGSGRPVEPDGHPGGSELAERAHEVARLVNIGERFQSPTHLARELAAVDIERWPALPGEDGEREREWRVMDVGAADVERPGHRLRIRYDQRIGTQLRQLAPDAVELVLRRLSGEAQVVQRDRAERRGRAVGPDGIDQVGLDRLEFRPGRGAGLGEALGTLCGVQPWVVAD